MKLWLLQAIDSESGPWSPWYDKAFGFVVRAATEEDARQIAAHYSEDEGHEAWLSPTLSTCHELTPSGQPGLILRDFARA